jgi:hypothetical protein
MADDLTKRGPEDRSRISLGEPWELRHWCKKFGCFEEDLRARRVDGRAYGRRRRRHFAN